MIRELDSKSIRSEQYDSLVQSYSEAKSDFLTAHEDPADSFIQKHLESPAGKVLLDIGCGTGDEAVKYEHMGFATVQGLDPSPKMLEQAKTKVAHPENFHLGTYERTNFPDRSVDIVVGKYSLHYVENVDAAYKELARILKPAGLLILVPRNPAWDVVAADRFVKNGKEYVRTLVYERVPVESPVHTTEEYLSGTFRQYFDLIEIEDGTKSEVSDKSAYFFLGMAARRREE